MSSIVNGFIVFSLIITIAYFLGLLTFFSDYEPNRCEMTYMFEFPQFVRISQEIDQKYPKYGLHAYSEGRITERSRNMYFDGIPVLFIPGNAGSYRQARSLASIALRKALNSGHHFYFDYFMVDLNDELSGLNGALLSDQLEYTNTSIYRILDLYKERKNQPRSVILYAHSVGGVIARRLVSALPENSTLIPIVLTLASPHKRPPIVLDSYTYEFYRRIDLNKTTNTTFVSITGGYSDFLVPSFLTTLPDNGLNVVSHHVPRAWISADHVCIVWCKQLILAINRALFDSVDPKTKQISTNPQLRRDMFYHHLVHHNGLNPHLRNSYPLSSANLRNQGEWLEHLGRQYTINVSGHASGPRFYMLRLLDQPQHEFVTMVALNLKTIEWAFVCGAHIPQGTKRVCESFSHLSHLTELSPSMRYKRRTLRVGMHELMKNNSDWTHVVIRALPSDEEAILNVDIYAGSDRKLTVNLPNMLSFKRQIIIKETNEKALHYELAVPQLNHVMQSYQLFVDDIQCAHPQLRHATATLIVPWGHQNQHQYFTHTEKDPLNVRLFHSRPQWASNQSAVIQLSLDPTCRYRISVRSSIPGVLGQMARFYSPLLVVNVAAVLLMALNAQMKSIANDRKCSLIFVALSEGAKPYYILTSVKLISRFLSMKSFTTYFPVPDWVMMSQDGTDFFLLPLLLYICSVGIVWLAGIILYVSLVLCETTVHKLALKFLAKTVSFTVSFSDYVMSALHKLPFVMTGLLICLTLTTTGGLALCVGMAFYFMRLTQLSQDYIEELVWYYVKKIGEKFKTSKPKDKVEKKPEEKDNGNNNNNNKSETSTQDAMFFHATIFLLWSLITLINAPSVLTWAHNFKFSTKLEPDPAFFPGLILSVCSLALWQLDLPKIERKGYAEVGHFVSVLAVVSLIYAPISIFRLNYTLTATIVSVILHQLAAPNRDLTVETTRSPPDWYEMMKAKLE